MTEEFPTGALNECWEKNMAYVIFNYGLDVEAIRKTYAKNNWDARGLLGWIKKVEAGEINNLILQNFKIGLKNTSPI